MPNPSAAFPQPSTPPAPGNDLSDAAYLVPTLRPAQPRGLPEDANSVASSTDSPSAGGARWSLGGPKGASVAKPAGDGGKRRGGAPQQGGGAARAKPAHAIENPPAPASTDAVEQLVANAPDAVAPAERGVSARVRRKKPATPDAPGGGSKRGKRPRRRATTDTSAGGDSSGNHREGTLKFRVHKDEKAYFEAAAARDGYTSTAAWLERAARAAAERTGPGRDDQLDDLIGAVSATHDALRRIGHNMNQVARVWNTLVSGHESADPLAALHHEALADLGAMLRRTDQAMQAVLDQHTPTTGQPVADRQRPKRRTRSEQGAESVSGERNSGRHAVGSASRSGQRGEGRDV